MPVLLIESTKGVPRAVVFTYACHCTSIRNGQEGFYKYHPDYAGVAAEQIERQLPVRLRSMPPVAPETSIRSRRVESSRPKRTGNLYQPWCSPHSIKPSDGDPGPLRTTYREIALPLAAIPSRQKYVELSHEPDLLPAAARSHYFVLVRRWMREPLPKKSFPIQIWRFGKDLTLVALSGEVVVDYALRLKKELGADRTWVVAYANEVPCYIPQSAS